MECGYREGTKVHLAVRTRDFSTQLGQRHIIISQSQVLSDEAALHTKEVKYIAGASLPGPQVGGRKGDQGRVGCLPSVPK